MTDLIRQMEATLAQLDAQREALATAIAALTGVPDTRPAVKPARVKTPRPTPPRAPRKASEAPPRPTGAPSDDPRGAILAALQDGPLPSAIIRARLKLGETQIAYQLKKLKAAGVVAVTGKTNRAIWRSLVSTRS